MEGTIANLLKESWKKAMDYTSYRTLIDQLLAEGKTTGPQQTEKLIHYSYLNVKRMKRLDKTIKLTEDLRVCLDHLHHTQFWLVLTEAWCGDAAQIVPLFRHIETFSDDKLVLKFLLRDDNPELMDQFLTHGTRSIPKLIVLDPKHFSVLGTWGPRPKQAQEMVMEFKRNPHTTYKEFHKELQLWYTQNKTNCIQEELIPLIEMWDTHNEMGVAE